jgi:hypothetical protein
MVSMTILHELAHAVTAVTGVEGIFSEIQDLPDGDRAYGWENVYRNDEAIAIKNADNYAYLALWAGLADWGYTLPRTNGLQDKELKRARKNAKKGLMIHYDDITKRTLEPLHFSA